MQLKGRSYLLILLSLSLSIFWGLGKFLDTQAEERINQQYQKDKNGVIKGLEAKEITHGNPSAVILLHGFLSTPAIFEDLTKKLVSEKKMDVFVPLLPFHGKNLKIASQFSNDQILEYARNYIDSTAKKYQKVVLIGYSYGGALLINLDRKNELPKNISLILYAPSLFITSNDFSGNIKLSLYGLWRNYCNYPFLGCGSPTYESGDAASHHHIDREQTLEYKVISAVQELYALDIENREHLQKMQVPYDLIIAEDDNRVNYKLQKESCLNNHFNCKLNSFPSGRHLLHWSRHQQQFENLIIKLVQQNIQQKSTLEW